MLDGVKFAEIKPQEIPDFEIRVANLESQKAEDFCFELVIKPTLYSDTVKVRSAWSMSSKGDLIFSQDDVFKGNFSGITFSEELTRRAFEKEASQAILTALMHPVLYSSDNSRPSPSGRGGNHFSKG